MQLYASKMIFFFIYSKNDASAGGEPFDKLSSDKAYDMVYDLRLTEEQLVANGYPRTGKKPGTAKIQCTKPMRRPNDTERYCGRCGKVFNLQMYDEVCVDECNYHPKGTGYRRGLFNKKTFIIREVFYFIFFYFYYFIPFRLC